MDNDDDDDMMFDFGRLDVIATHRERERERERDTEPMCNMAPIFKGNRQYESREPMRQSHSLNVSSIIIICSISHSGPLDD